MTIYTKSTLGYHWSDDELRAGFGGAEETSDDVDFLVDETMRRWSTEIAKRDWDIGWVPQTSELHHPVGLQVDPDELDEIRERITTAIWDEWCDGTLVREAAG